MRLRVLGLVCVLVLLCSGISSAATEEIDSLSNDTLQVVLFWTGASMRGHVVDSVDGKLVFERVDGQQFKFKLSKIFAITDEAGFEETYTRLKGTPRPRPRDVVESVLGIGFLNNRDYSSVKLMAGIGVRFLDRIHIGLATEYNDLEYSDVVTWMLAVKYYVPLGKRALFLYAAPGLAVNTRRIYREEGQYGFTCAAGIGVRTNLEELAGLFAQAGYQYININSGPLVPKEYVLKADLFTISVGISFAIARFNE